MNAWLHRALLAGLLLAAYLWAWTPARSVWTRYSAAILERTVDMSGKSECMAARPMTHALRVETSEGTSHNQTAPAGVKFLLPSFFLILIVPKRPRLGWLFAGHLGLGSLSLILLACGIAGLPGGFVLSRFVQTYGLDAYSLSLPTFLIVHSRTVCDRFRR